MDDALSLLFLFASLPSTVTIPPKTIALCQRLCLEFQHYLIVTHSLRKSFLSIKGIYYQATVQGQDILWLVPYKFVQRVTGDVDFRIMGTFVEFYTTLLGFVNFRLYTSVGLVYPPNFDAKSDERGGELDALVLEGRSVNGKNEDQPGRIESSDSAHGTAAPVNDALQKKVDQVDIGDDGEAELTEESGSAGNPVGLESDTIDRFEMVGAGGDTLLQPQMSNTEASTLFSPFTFFISREAPRQPLEFILRAFGCKRIGWDEVLGDGAYTNHESDASITHQIVDRPPPPISNGTRDTASPFPELGHGHSWSLPPGSRVLGRTYIQPQWVWDCVNEGRLLRTDLYAPGATLPPHLSPWVKAKKGAYDPTVSLEEQEREGEAEEFAEEEAEAAALEAQEEEADKSAVALEAPRHEDEIGLVETEDPLEDHGMRVGLGDDLSVSDAAEKDISGFDKETAARSGSEDQAEVSKDAHQAELEAEAAGLPPGSTRADGRTEPLKEVLKSSSAGDEARRRGQQKRRKEEEELQRRMGMMSGKKRKLLEKMMHGRKKGDAQAEVLRRKRRKVELEKKASSTSH